MSHNLQLALLAGVISVATAGVAPAPAAPATRIAAPVARAVAPAAAAPTTPAERIRRLRATATTLRRTAAELPAAASPAESKDAEAYGAWLTANAGKLEALASEGERALARKDAVAIQSFNLQYLQLQSQMQHENRSYTAISNIMKTKHDTVKNSISNIR